jgi:hypothetical protein
MYRFTIDFYWQIGFLIRVNTEVTKGIMVNLPFIELFISLDKYSTGFRVWNWFDCPHPGYRRMK